ncbi:MAG: hypothetical protein PVJ42_04235 [bacterium]|jgi:hypothetical protein
MDIRSRYLIFAAVTVMLLATAAGAAADGETSRFEAELEAGPVWQTRNDAQIPNTAEGTRFSLVDVIGKGPWPSARLYLTWNINPKHGLMALLAPLSVTETGVLGSPVDFAGATFEPDVPTEATYKFNSWRITYRYRFYSNERWDLRVGFTAKIRDAKIELAQEDRSARKTDLGFVPLLHFAADYTFARSWHVKLDFDALAGGPGRAEDASLKIGYGPGEGWLIYAGYRTVEGGADVEEVYNFAWLHYAVISVKYRF